MVKLNQTRDFPTLTYPLTLVDKQILRSQEPVLTMLKNLLGNDCEVVLHSLADLQCSVIKIVNSHLTDRTVGAPITSTALNMLKQMTEEKTFVTDAYFTHAKNGQKMRSITQAVLGENDRIIGLLCVNLSLDTPLHDFMSFLLSTNTAQAQSAAAHDIKNHEIKNGELFAENIDDLFNQTVEKVISRISYDPTIGVNNKNKLIIAELYQQGLFELKGATKAIANLLGISTHTVYLHLRNCSST
ncbi:helix-turn-helix transcriptional regulator [Testudinibacter sp. TR-2022]|uniref:helix-turn-helix transcriptional regulator n=1 Tax=Testudinibacter sp. TR-2022 TaxID=2585029 RepID=UPI00111B613B|nr:PAS domain-containing protein [Testudinibacter sp. TR-2022]TNH05420.1 hypothetical protein FHQ30_10590 [Pasteurellaceae bacterium Phil11]TNH21546.1 hypothetical protein FHQ29_09775 [Testudinibacter sp. TR-2022]TNH25947.1 hypothetical protein FHQ27_08350 [Testudinibacter sp. TR-2022]